jgi:hypothetical protein
LIRAKRTFLSGTKGTFLSGTKRTFLSGNDRAKNFSLLPA